MSYKLLANGCVLRLSDNAAIPPTMDNCDWVAYQAWLNAGNKPLPVEITPPAPKTLQDGDLVALLLAKRLITQADIDAAIAAS